MNGDIAREMSTDEIPEGLEYEPLLDSETMTRLKDATECVLVQRFKEPTEVVLVLTFEDVGGVIRMPLSKWFDDSVKPFLYRVQRELGMDLQLSPSEWEGLRAYWTQTATVYGE